MPSGTSEPHYKGKSLSGWISETGQETSRERTQAIVSLARFGSKAKAAVPALKRLLNDRSYLVQEMAATAIVEIERSDESVAIALAELLKRKNSAVRAAAAKALGRMGANAEVAFSALGESLVDVDDSVREAAIEALAGIGPSVVPNLIELLSDSDEDIQRGSIAVLGMLGAKAKASASHLRQLLTDKSVSESAEWALRKIRQGRSARWSCEDRDALRRLVCRERIGPLEE